jgi:hypothetical protein
MSASNDHIMKLASWVSHQRSRLNQSQQAFADTLGLKNHVQVYKLESGLMLHLSQEVLSRLLDYAKSIGQSADDIFGMPKPVALIDACVSQLATEMSLRFGAVGVDVRWDPHPAPIGFGSAGVVRVGNPRGEVDHK